MSNKNNAGNRAGTAPLLRAVDLEVSYANSASGKPAIRGVSFELHSGKVLGIIGESGAGKSSLALALMKLHDPEQVSIAGEVFFGSKNLLALDEEDLCRLRGAGISMIFQDPAGALDPSMKIVSQVAETIQLHKGINRRSARDEARDRLAEVGLSDEILSVAPYAHQLSGGLCQRAMIAAALACNPAVLIADEPTSSLDVTLQAQIISLLEKKRHASGLAIIHISHDVALVSSFADEIMVLQNGEVVEQGNCDTVVSQPRHPHTAELVSFWRLSPTGSGAHAAS